MSTNQDLDAFTTIASYLRIAPHSAPAEAMRAEARRILSSGLADHRFGKAFTHISDTDLFLDACAICGSRIFRGVEEHPHLASSFGPGQDPLGTFGQIQWARMDADKRMVFFRTLDQLFSCSRQKVYDRMIVKFLVGDMLEVVDYMSNTNPAATRNALLINASDAYKKLSDHARDMVSWLLSHCRPNDMPHDRRNKILLGHAHESNSIGALATLMSGPVDPISPDFIWQDADADDGIHARLRYHLSSQHALMELYHNPPSIAELISPDQQTEAEAA